jgi:hypothetical protein
MFEFLFCKPSKASPISVLTSESDSSYPGSDVEPTSIDGQSPSVDGCFVATPGSEEESEDSIMSDAIDESEPETEPESAPSAVKPTIPPRPTPKVRRTAAVRKTPIPLPPVTRRVRVPARKTRVPRKDRTTNKAVPTSPPSNCIPQTFRGKVEKRMKVAVLAGRRVRKTQLQLLLEAAGDDMNWAVAMKAYAKLRHGDANVD